MEGEESAQPGSGFVTRSKDPRPIVFGHWSQLGFVRDPGIVGLDSGCVWGGALSALRLEDGALYQVACPGYQATGGES